MLLGRPHEAGRCQPGLLAGGQAQHDVGQILVVALLHARFRHFQQEGIASGAYPKVPQAQMMADRLRGVSRDCLWLA